MTEFKIMDIARRKKDLIDKGVAIHDDKKENGLMLIYMSESDIKINKEKFARINNNS